MKFNIGTCAINEESAEPTKITAPVDDKNITTEENSHKEDETIANIDNTLSDTDLIKFNDEICPLTGDIYAAMKNAAADPKNLKIITAKKGDGELASYIEASEFQNFLEASGLTVDEAYLVICEAHLEEIPELYNAEFHVVFPSDTIEQLKLGGGNCGLATNEDWAMKLIRGCRRYGLKVTGGLDRSTITEEAEVEPITEAFGKIKQYKELTDAIDYGHAIAGSSANATPAKKAKAAAGLTNKLVKALGFGGAGAIAGAGTMATIKAAAVPVVGKTLLLPIGIVATAAATIAALIIPSLSAKGLSENEKAATREYANDVVSGLRKALDKTNDAKQKEKIQSAINRIEGSLNRAQ